MGTGEDNARDGTEPEAAFERLADAIELLGAYAIRQRTQTDQEQLGAYAIRQRTQTDQEQLVWLERFGAEQLCSMVARLACSLAFAARRRAPRRVQSREAFDVLRDWLSAPGLDVRSAMPYVFVTSDELRTFDSFVEFDALDARLFRGESWTWQSIAPRALHQAIGRTMLAPIEVVLPNRVCVDRAANPMPSTASAADWVVDRTFGAALRTSFDRGDRSVPLVSSPRCRTGTMLLAAVCAMRRELESTPRMTILTEAALRAFVRDQCRGYDDDPRLVSLARLGLWLETGELLSGDDLRAAVAYADRYTHETKRSDDAPAFVFADVSNDRSKTLFESVMADARVGDTVGVLVDCDVAVSPAMEPQRAAWDCDFMTLRPIVEPRLRTAIERPRTLALVAKRHEHVPGELSERWAYTLEGASPVDRKLLLSLSLEPRLSTIAESSGRQIGGSGRPDRDWPRVLVDRAKSPLDAVLVPSAQSPDAMLFWAKASGWDGFSLYALLRSTLVRWQRAMLAESRGGTQTHTMLDVFELAVASFCDAAALREAGVELAAARDAREIQAALEAVDQAAGFRSGLDGESKAMLSKWRALTALPEVIIVDGSAIDRPPAAPAQSGPRAPDVASPRVTGAHDPGAFDTHTKTSSPAAIGRGSESALRGRADDGRAAPVPGPKRKGSQPEDAAEREAWAILRAAGPDGLTLRELVRRAREHEEDELREAVVRLLESGWVARALESEGESALADTTPLRALAR